MQGEKKQPIRYFFQRFANKYTFVTLVFVIWIVLFDKYSFIDKIQLQSKILKLENEKQYYKKKIEEDNRKKRSYWVTGIISKNSRESSI